MEAGARALDALARLRGAPLTESDPALARRLVQLRHAASREMIRTQRPSGATVPRLHGQAGLPIEPPPGASLDSLTGASVRAQFQRHGCVLVRNMVPPQVVAKLIATIDRAFAASDAFVKKRPREAGWFEPILDVAGGAETRGWVREAGGVLAADSPLALEILLRAYAELGIERLVADYFGERPAIAAEKTTLRKIHVTHESDWHQDGRFLGTNIRSLNVWVALTDCGVEAPGLDVVPLYPDRVMETGTGKARFDWTIDHGVVLREFGANAIWCPHFQAGDALLFDHMLVHRTGYGSSMTRTRYALETWFLAPSAYL